MINREKRNHSGGVHRFSVFAVFKFSYFSVAQHLNGSVYTCGTSGTIQTLSLGPFSRHTRNFQNQKVVVHVNQQLFIL